MDKQLQDKLLSLIDGMQDAAVAATPKATQLALEVARLNVIGTLLGATVAFVGMVVLGRFFFKRTKKLIEEDEDELMVLSGAACVGICIFGMISFFILLDPIKWVGIARPEIIIANQVYHKVLLEK